MRFLCLHGMGTSARIFEAQMSQVAGNLVGQHEFVYIDGEIESGPIAGVDAFFSGPYFCFYELPTPDQVQAAFELIWDTIAEDGPFDGIVGFSQGAALASSFLLSDARSDSPQNPFKCGIFFCASMPFDLISTPFTVSSKGVCRYAHNGEVMQGFDVSRSIPETKNSGWFGTYNDETQFLHRYNSPHANPEKARIMIPTTHIVGVADGYYTQSCQLRDLCLEQNRQFMEHRQGHDIPKDRATTNKMAGCIQNMLHDVLVG